MTKWASDERTGSRQSPLARTRRPQRRSIVSSSAMTRGPLGAKASMRRPSRIRAPIRGHHVARLSTRWWVTKRRSRERPVTRSTLVTVRPVRRQQRADQEHLGVAPGAVDEQRREGPDDPGEAGGQLRHGASLGGDAATLPATPASSPSPPCQHTPPEWPKSSFGLVPLPRHGSSFAASADTTREPVQGGQTTAADRDACSPSCSRTLHTARSRRSAGHGALVLPPPTSPILPNLGASGKAGAA